MSVSVETLAADWMVVGISSSVGIAVSRGVAEIMTVDTSVEGVGASLEIVIEDSGCVVTVVSGVAAVALMVDS